MTLKKEITQILILPAAESEYSDFAAYYEEQQTGLGVRFVNEFTQKLNYLRQYPFAFQYRFRRYRVAFMANFPCIIVYKVHKNVIIVYAIMHNRQNPKRLRKLK